MTILLSDPRIAMIPVEDNGEPLVTLGPEFGANEHQPVAVRAGLGARLTTALSLLPEGYGLRVVEGYRTAADQQAIVAAYSAQLRAAYGDLDEAELRVLTSRYVAPLEVAPHVAGAAVDLTLVDGADAELWLGSAFDATPEESDGACYFDAPVDPEARANREIMAGALSAAGLVNYPTEWWHWSYGDRYWAQVTSRSFAVYGPLTLEAAA